MSQSAWRALLIVCCLLTPPAWATPRERSCHIDGIETPVTCVTLQVPRDYAQPDAATLTLTAVIVPATTGRPAADPLIMLAGGPGQAATRLPAVLSSLLNQVRRQRAVILFDVRGTGLSEALHCELPESLISSDAPPTDSFTMLRVGARQCAQQLGRRARHHTDREVVEDLERLRRALGLQQINLWGASFGTRVAQHYVRAYGKHVRTLVLDGVTPVGSSALITGAHTPDAALDTLLQRCQDDARCAAAFPDLSAKLQHLLASTSERPLAVSTIDPLSGRPGKVLVDYFMVSNAIRTGLYSHATTELLPLAIDRAAAGDFTPLIGMLGAFSGDDSVAFGAQFSMLCAEDWLMARDAEPAARTGKFMRDGYYASFTQACENWTHQPLPAGMLTPLDSAVPVLAISGDSDPVTPPQLATQALAQFKQSVHVIVPRGFHINSQRPCVIRITTQFLADPAKGGRDHACIATTPALNFVTGPAS